MGFHLTYGAVLASILSPSANAVAFLPLILPVVLVVVFLVVGRSKPQYRRGVPLLLIAVLIAFTLPLGIVPLQEAQAGWQVTAGRLTVETPPQSAQIALDQASWSVVAMSGYYGAMRKLNGFSDPSLDSGSFQFGAKGQANVLIYGRPKTGVLILAAGQRYLVATPNLAVLEGALRQDSGPPSP